MQLTCISGKVVPGLLRGQALYLKEQVFTEAERREAKTERREGGRKGKTKGGREEMKRNQEISHRLIFQTFPRLV